MYICDHCGHTSERGEVANKIVIEKRDKTYPLGTDYETGERRVSTGWEIVKEEKWCGHCKLDPDWVAKQVSPPAKVSRRKKSDVDVEIDAI